MSRYENGKIYRITDVGYNKCYIGSTCEELSQRMARHRYKYTQYLKGKKYRNTVFKMFDDFDVENCKIEWIEDYPCNSKKELEAREGYYIKNSKCVNKRVEGRTDKEYRDDNKEREQERHKKYYEENQDKIKAYREANKERRAEYSKTYREENKELIRIKKKEHREKNKDKINESQKQIYEANKEERQNKNRENYAKNKDKYKLTCKKYYEQNKEHITEQRKVKFTCECGRIVRKDGKTEHERSQVHQQWLQQQKQPEQEPE